jgi:hypothetical protein
MEHFDKDLEYVFLKIKPFLGKDITLESIRQTRKNNTESTESTESAESAKQQNQQSNYLTKVKKKYINCLKKILRF